MTAASSDHSRFDPSVAYTLIFVSRTLARYRWFILAFTLLLVIGAAFAGVYSTPIYRASLTAYPVSSAMTPGSSLRGIASQLGLGADPSQMSLTPSADETLAVLQSRDLTVNFIRRHNLMPLIFLDEWDQAQHAWKPETIVHRVSRLLRGDELNPNGPTDYEAALEFDRLRHVVYNIQSGIVTVSIDYRDPVIAAKWTNDLVEETDSALRDRALKESDLGLAYLQKQAANASLSDLRGAIYQVASGEITKSMLAKVRTNFALKVLDPATPPLRPVWPRLIILVGLALMGGLFLSTVFALVWNYLRQLSRFSKLVVGPDIALAKGLRESTQTDDAR